MGESRVWVPAAAGLLLGMCGVWAAAPVPAGTDPNEALKDLMAGNQRYVEARRAYPHQDAELRARLAKGQHPIAVILGCADSRVPPELVFDEGLGDLFTVRLAGELPDDLSLGSIEYAVEHLGTRLIVVLGHQKCGAVDAAMHSPSAPGHIQALLAAIQPAIQGASEAGHDALDAAVRANVRHVVAALEGDAPILAEAVKSGHVRIVGAEYELESGKIELLSRP
ncbi:MAG: carbonic anhydrase [Candidatus Wallbacteria bacterium]|nr:carbonic anhydrase [Candidatus Wallbacteria bacterium]